MQDAGESVKKRYDRCPTCHGTGRVALAAEQIALVAPPIPGWTDFKVSYPRKKAWPDAERAWSRLKPSQTLAATILRALAAQLEAYDWKKDPKGIYWPYPATWINGRRWEDEVDAAPADHWKGITVGDLDEERRELDALMPRRREG